MWNWLKDLLRLSLFWLYWLSFFGNSLVVAQDNPNLNKIKNSLLQTSIQLEQLNNQLLSNWTSLKKDYSLLKVQLTQSEQELAQARLLQQEALTSLESSKDSYQQYQQTVDAEILSLKWERYEWAVGGFVVGISITALLFALY